MHVNEMFHQLSVKYRLFPSYILPAAGDQSASVAKDVQMQASVDADINQVIL